MEQKEAEPEAHKHITHEHLQRAESVKERPKKKSKFFTYLVIILIIAGVYFFLREPLISLLKTIPWLWNFIAHVTTEIENKTYLGLIYLAFFGGIFFIILPIEGTFLLYIASGKEFFLVIPIIVAAYTAGLLIDYAIGFVLGKWVARKILKERFEERQEKMKKTGGIVLFFSNILPLPIPWISLVYGAMRFKLKNFLIICLIGQAVKFNLLYLGIEFLKPYYTQAWEVVKNLFGGFHDVLKGLF